MGRPEIVVVLAESHRLVAEVLAERDPVGPGRSADLRDAVLARTGADDAGEPADAVFPHPPRPPPTTRTRHA